MKNLKFNYLAANNFLPFGQDGIKIELSKMGNIVLIRGDNLDIQDEEEKIASNGTGKSSVPEILVYCLYGKTIKQPKKLNHADVINNKVGKKLYTEVWWDKYRVVRMRKPDTLRMWESEEQDWSDANEITLGGIPATQKLIEEKIGLTYEAFVNVVVFTDNNAGSFLECDLPTKREIVENLLSLDKYRVYFESAKKARNEIKNKVQMLSKAYEYSLVEVDSANKRIIKIKQQEVDWKAQKQKEIAALLDRHTEKQKLLQSTDTGYALAKYQAAQNDLTQLNEAIFSVESDQGKIVDILNKAKERHDVLRNEKASLDLTVNAARMSKRNAEQKIEESKKKINGYESKKDTKCGACLGVIKEENYLGVVQYERKIISDNQDEVIKQDEILAELQPKLDTINANASKVKAGIDAANSKSLEFAAKLVELRRKASEAAKVPKPVVGAEERVLEDQIAEIKKQLVDKRKETDGLSPYVEILKSAEEELLSATQSCDQKKKEVADAEEELPYYEFWVKAFGDTGIRKFVIDGIVPALNTKVAYWLQFLIDNKIKLTFDNKLEEVIERNPSDGDPFVYHAMSGGERRRLNLAVSQAFAHVMMLNSGTSPSVVFLDEVTTNVDPIGVQGVYNMIMELSKEKQVFVTTHDHDLLEMLGGCETLNLVKKDGFTKIK